MKLGYLLSIVVLFTVLAIAETKKITPDECKGTNRRY